MGILDQTGHLQNQQFGMFSPINQMGSGGQIDMRDVIRKYSAEDVQKVFEATFAELMKLREAGQKEYAHDPKRPFRNFESIAADLDMSREYTLWTHMKKHLDGILAYIKGHKSQRESVVGRIHDTINYLILLKAMYMEQEGKNPG